MNLDRIFKIQAGGKPIHLSQIGSLYQKLQHLLLPVSIYHHSKYAIVNLLSFAKFANEHYIIYNTQELIMQYTYRARITGNTYYFNKTISSTYTTWILVKPMWTSIAISTHYEARENIIFRLDQKRVGVVSILQKLCGFPSDEDFINALEYNSIEGVDFGRRDVDIANNIYGYSKGAAREGSNIHIKE